MLEVEIEHLGSASVVLVTPEEYAEIYSRSVSGVYKLIERKKVPSITVEGRLYIPMAGEQVSLMGRQPEGKVKIERVADGVWVIK